MASCFLSRLYWLHRATKAWPGLASRFRSASKPQNLQSLAAFYSGPPWDAMGLTHARCVEGFCIVSSDSDLVGVAARIQEAGLLVYGFGERQTMKAFVVASDEFMFVDAV